MTWVLEALLFFGMIYLQMMGLDKLHADTVIFALVIFVGVGLVLRSYTVKPRQADPPAAGPH